MVIPAKKSFERNKERFQLFGEADDLKHNGNLQSILVLANPHIEEIAVYC